MTFRKALIQSVEWRLWAVVITVSVLMLNHLPLGKVGAIAVETQFALFIAQAAWIYFKSR